MSEQKRTIKEAFRDFNGRTFCQTELLRTLAPLRVEFWLFPEIDAEDLAKEGLAQGWITVDDGGIFTINV